MTDLREGRIQAFLESEMEPEGRREFISEMAGDSALAEAVDAQRQRIETVSATLDEAFGQDHISASNTGEIAAAWTAVQRRLGTVDPSLALDLTTDAVSGVAHAPHARPRWRWVRGPAAKAAGLLLVAAGAATAAAMPGSPLRDWAEARLGGAPATPTVAVDVTADPPVTGLRLTATDGTIRVLIREPLASASLTIRMVDGDVLEVLAGSGTSFSTSEGQIEISEIRGPVVIQLPRAQGRAVVEVAGAVYLHKVGERIEVLQAGADSLPSEFVFNPPGREPTG